MAVTMVSKNQYIHTRIYESNGVKVFAQSDKDEAQKVAFLYPTMAVYLKSEIPSKKVVDIGCGTGNWCYRAALSGAKSVDGFDIQEEMVELAKQATSQFGNVNICVGDVMDMPYEDNTFDVALSFYLTCGLHFEACIKHFQEMYRILAPGGKAVMVSYSEPAFEQLHLTKGADRVLVENQIKIKLTNLPCFPSQDQLNDAFIDLHDVLQVFFTLDLNDKLQRITDASRMSNGQAICTRTQVMTFANYFYHDEFLQQQIKSSGLKINNVESYYTEDRRITYNNTNPEFELDKMLTDTPPFMMHHLSKPANS